MTTRPHPARLAVGEHPFGGTEINRARPLRFRLNGRTVSGFAGDSVLSAALAAGINEIGALDGAPLALSERFNPAILPVGTKDLALAMPMDRTPAVDGAEWHTTGLGAAPGRFATVFGDRSSLGLRLSDQGRGWRPWLDRPAATTTACDLVIVGGGVAGMNAAVAAGKLGMHVALIERQAQLGGNGAMFGTLDGEESAAEAVSRLGSEIAALSNVSVFCRAEAYAVRPGRVELHVVEIDGTVPKGRSVALTAKNIILATGTQERLPVFSGNRMPGVTTAVAAYEEARRFGIWPGSTAVLATAASAPYRLATHAHDAGIAFSRLVDVRPNPQSRFIEFTKAYGLTQVSGTRVAAVTRSRGQLQINLVLDHAGARAEATSLTADRLVVSGGFQPSLALWLNAGGTAEWVAARHRLEPGAGPEGIALAGSAAGWLSRRACQQSGVDAVNKLLGRKPQPVFELAIDTAYETPDAATPVHAPTGPLPAFLDAGDSLIAAPGAPVRSGMFGRKHQPWQLAEAAQAFDLADVAAAVQLGAIAPNEAGTVARERTSMTVQLALPDGVPEPPKTVTPLVPPYLVGRFGADAVLWEIAADPARPLDTGSLVFRNSDETNPLDAIGVIVGSGETGLALMNRRLAIAGHGITVRDQGQPISARLIAPCPADPLAPLGGSAGPA